MPSSRQARMIRNAISPRFAMRIFENIVAGCQLPVASQCLTGNWPLTTGNYLRGLHQEQHRPELHGVAVLDEDSGDRAAALGLDVVEGLHRFDDADVGVFIAAR